MEVRILHKFHDKASYNTVYLVGETVTFDDARAEHLISLGLVEAIKVPEKSAKAEPIEEAVEKPVAAKRKSSK